MKSKYYHARASAGTGFSHDDIISIDPSDRENIDGSYARSVVEGEQALMFAILENAINDFQKYFVVRSPREKRRYAEAVGWILGQNTDWLFSFENICENVGLNPGYLRRRLRVWAEDNGCTSKNDKFSPAKRLRRRSLR